MAGWEWGEGEVIGRQCGKRGGGMRRSDGGGITRRGRGGVLGRRRE